MVAWLLWWAITLYIWVLVARAFISFIPLIVRDWTPRGLVLILVEGIYTITDPPLKALSKCIPPIRMGNVMLDMSFLVLLIGLQFVQVFVRLLPF